MCKPLRSAPQPNLLGGICIGLSSLPGGELAEVLNSIRQLYISNHGGDWSEVLEELGARGFMDA